MVRHLSTVETGDQNIPFREQSQKAFVETITKLDTNGTTHESYEGALNSKCQSHHSPSLFCFVEYVDMSLLSNCFDIIDKKDDNFGKSLAEYQNEFVYRFDCT